ncbi:uncharacterized protein V1516DRAFT_674688 [Lipomyces oligophaga]|uniref:uncharacterized protein n=1 Tax=Lipomyces oligophaga TaxID=45792 RepID=UPI0034CFECBE
MTEVLTNILLPGRISAVAGPQQESSFRTVLAMHIVAAHLVENPHMNATWIDTLGSFQPFRMRDVVIDHLRGDYDHPEQEQDVDLYPSKPTIASVMDRISLIRAFDDEGLMDSLTDLDTPSAVSTESAKGIYVVDSVSYIFTHAMREDQITGHASMVSYLKQLRLVSMNNRLISVLLLPTVATSEADMIRSQFPGIDIKPALGPTFLYTIDFCALLFRDSQSGIHIFEVIADRFDNSENQLLTFELTNHKLAFHRAVSES